MDNPGNHVYEALKIVHAAKGYDPAVIAYMVTKAGAGPGPLMRWPIPAAAGLGLEAAESSMPGSHACTQTVDVHATPAQPGHGQPGAGTVGAVRVPSPQVALPQMGSATAASAATTATPEGAAPSMYMMCGQTTPHLSTHCQPTGNVSNTGAVRLLRPQRAAGKAHIVHTALAGTAPQAAAPSPLGTGPRGLAGADLHGEVVVPSHAVTAAPPTVNTSGRSREGVRDALEPHVRAQLPRIANVPTPGARIRSNGRAPDDAYAQWHSDVGGRGFTLLESDVITANTMHADAQSLPGHGVLHQALQAASCASMQPRRDTIVAIFGSFYTQEHSHLTEDDQEEMVRQAVEEIRDRKVCRSTVQHSSHANVLTAANRLSPIMQTFHVLPQCVHFSGATARECSAGPLRLPARPCFGQRRIRTFMRTSESVVCMAIAAGPVQRSKGCAR